MSSNVMMPNFASDPATTGQVVRVWRRRGFAVDIGDPLIDVRIGQHAVLTVGTHRDGGI